jgi:hypothetical protein
VNSANVGDSQDLTSQPNVEALPAFSQRRYISKRSAVHTKHALAGRLLLCQVGLRRRSRAALAGRAGLPGWGCFIPSTSRWATTPWPGRKLGDDGGGLVTGLQPGHGAVGRCQVNGMKRKQSARVQAASATVPLDSTVRSKP